MVYHRRAEHTNGWRDWRPVSRQGHLRLARLRLSNSAKQGRYGRGPADPGGVTSPAAVTSRLDGGPPADDARMNFNEAIRNERRQRT